MCTYGDITQLPCSQSAELFNMTGKQAHSIIYLVLRITREGACFNLFIRRGLNSEGVFDREVGLNTAFIEATNLINHKYLI